MRAPSRILLCAGLVLVSAAAAFSQTPKSGALLEIDGTVTTPDTASAPVHFKVYDSQIHTGVVQVPSTNAESYPEGSNCGLNDEIPTDAYILQAAAADGCDQGTQGEANLAGYTGLITITSATYPSVNYDSSNTDYSYTVLIGPDLVCCGTITISGMTNPANNGTFSVVAIGAGTVTLANAAGVSANGQSGIGKGVYTGLFRFVSSGAPSYEFDIITNYVCGPFEDSCRASSVTNENGNITSNDSGFLTVLNNGSSTFTGTIKLSGTPGSNSEDCASPGPDLLTFPRDGDDFPALPAFAPGTSYILALANDASACSGFNAPQSLVLQGTTTVNITAASQSESNNTTYTYTLTAGSPLTVGQIIIIDGMTTTPPGLDNGAFTIVSLSSGTFTVLNANGVTVAGQNGTGTQSNTFLFGNDAYTISPSSTGAGSGVGDTFTFLPVPVPAGPLGKTISSWSMGYFGTQLAPENPVFVSPLRFSPGTNFPGQACIPFSDFSALNNPVCPELQLDCFSGEVLEGGDCTTFPSIKEVNLAIDKNSLPNGVGGVEFLGVHADECPTTNFDINIFLSYTATTPDPTKGQSPGNSCFALTFDPAAAPVAVGTTVTQHTLVGFFPPVIDDPANHVFLNPVDPGGVVPLIWRTEDPSGKPVTDLHLCKSLTGSGCENEKPYVIIGSRAVSCSAPFALLGNTTLDASVFNSGLLDLGGGFYLFLWQTARSSIVGTCATPDLIFSTGFESYDVAIFKYER